MRAAPRPGQALAPTPRRSMADDLSSLRAQQRALAALLRQEAPPAHAADPLLRPLRGQPAPWQVYHQAYRARLTAALRSNHPALHRALGDEAFDALASDYLAAHPSRHPSIRWFGHQLGDFLARAAGHDHHPALADLARMEWALGVSFDAPDASPAGFAELAALPADAWPGLRFVPHPSVNCLDLGWAVEPLWQHLRAAEDSSREATDPPQPLRHTLLVWRQGLDTRWRSLPADEAALLCACLAGTCFADLCSAAARAAAGLDAAGPGTDAAWQMAARLRGWVDDGLLMRCDAEGRLAPQDDIAAA